MTNDYQKQYLELSKNDFLVNNIPLIHYEINKFKGNVCKQLNTEREDLVQDCFIKLFTAYDKYNPEKAKWSSFATKVIRNCVLMKLRKKTLNTVSISEKIDGTENLELIDYLGDIDQDIESIGEKELQNKVFEELNTQLTTSEKKILNILRSNDEITQREIAKKLNMTQCYISRMLKKITNKGKKIYIKHMR